MNDRIMVRVDAVMVFVMVMLSIIFFLLVVVFPFALYQEFKRNDATIEYIKRSKHSLDIEIK